MDFTLSDTLERRISDKVKRGDYASAEEAISAALDLLDARQKIDWLRDAVREGLESGEPLDANEQFWDSIKTEGARRVAAKSSSAQ